MKVNKKLLPVKGHFFFFNAGTAPLVPYLSTYARQLGFSSATVGLIYTILPIFGLIAKPLFGIIADRFKIQKTLFLIFQVVTIVSFSLIYIVPESENNVAVELDCGDGVTMLKSCYKNIDLVETCKIDTIGSYNTTSLCKMNCDMSSPKMWQTVCEHWHIPQYCYNSTGSIEYRSQIGSISEGSNSCKYISANNVTLDGYSYTPHCRIGNGYVDINIPCLLNCTDTETAAALMDNKFKMTCLNNTLHYQTCLNDSAGFANLSKGQLNTECQTKCLIDDPWELMEICEGWQADMAASCRPKTRFDEEFPSNLSFVGFVPLSTALSEHECFYVNLHQIELPDGSIHYPYCVSKAQYQMEADLFHASCNITCDNELINEVFQSAQESTIESSTQFTMQFWLFFLLMIISWIGQAVVVSIADAICFNLLGEKPSLYGRQRLWGSVGWGIFSLLTGTLIDYFSGDGSTKNYTIAFILMFVFMMGDVAVSCFIKNEPTRMSHNILADVGLLLSSLPTIIFFLWTIAVGLCTGLLWQFLFWLLEDISCDSTDYIKTLQGLVSAIQTFCGEIPFMFISGYLLKKIGHINMMSLVLFAFGLRFVLYSLLTNPWYVLPIEMLQGLTFGMFYPTMTSYANVVAPPGTETTVQGLVGAIFEGVGTSLGSFIGGILYERYGGFNTFRWFGYGSLVVGVVHVAVQFFLKDKLHSSSIAQGYSSVHYKHQKDNVWIMEEESD